MLRWSQTPKKSCSHIKSSTSSTWEYENIMVHFLMSTLCSEISISSQLHLQQMSSWRPRNTNHRADSRNNKNIHNSSRNTNTINNRKNRNTMNTINNSTSEPLASSFLSSNRLTSRRSSERSSCNPSRRREQWNQRIHTLQHDQLQTFFFHVSPIPAPGDCACADWPHTCNGAAPTTRCA